ncbi:hypothetical protein TPHA_0K02210 [Tetrapisispora phaffii CBS 4417]|uniref:YHL026C-like protein n=1 Tax=Tetrapisispora phaffii (strain ATCC 24235 / CBS 4417 / NBRC 1672 / NRRL Y-8282 / UCD 70-5) TaxID=1071381 RepID=G8BZM3_TETPH|nr:hypothetical protein TPHA_0K02210 [Tetrapisispora phaffii CBS 4417]CCE65351.1 hypothetical protein TPHA_0K02210 [Tetrapisispora phaffii CBS 4417]
MGLKNHLFTFYYVVLLQGVISGIISGGVEFAIAYGMYQKSKNLVTLWAFPNTFSGDCALTLFIQVGVTWVTQELIVGWDCYRTNNEIIKLPDFLLAEKPRNWFAFLYFEVNRGLIYKDYEEKPTLKMYLRKNFAPYIKSRGNFVNFCAWIVNRAIRGLIFGVALFLIVWPVTMGIMAGIGHRIYGHDYYFNNYPTPQIAKLIYGFVIGLITSPVCSMVVILRNYFYIDNIENSSNFKGYIATVNLGEETLGGERDLEKHSSSSETPALLDDEPSVPVVA